MSDAKAPAVALTPEQLQEVLRTVLQEARKPADLTPEQKAAEDTKKQHRKELALLVHQQNENRKIDQEMCTHLRRNGSTTGVYVQNGNYIICQACQKIIRPETETAMFNKIFYLCQAPADIF